MDIVYADGLPLYVPGNNLYPIYDMQLDRKINKSGSFSFTLPPGHPSSGSLRKLKSEIMIYRDDNRLWSGRIIESKRNIYGETTYTCEGSLGYLNDSSRVPFSFNGSPREYLKLLLNNHNAQMYTDPQKQFLLGIVTVSGYFAYDQTEPQSTWELLDSNLVQRFGGFLKIREEEGIKYLDYLHAIDNYCQQPIELGVNMLDIEEYIDAYSICNVLIPYGKNEDGNLIDIASVNDGNNYIQIANDVAAHTRIVKTVIYDDLSEPADIMEAGQAQLEQMVLEALTINASAVDLNDAGINTDRFDLGDNIRVYAESLGLDAMLPCYEISEKIGEPGSAVYTIGASFATMTGQQTATNYRVNISNSTTNRTVSALPRTLSGSVAKVIPESGMLKVTVTFSTAFTAAPEVLLMPQKSGISYQITGIAAQGFTFTASGTAGDSAVFSWIATK